MARLDIKLVSNMPYKTRRYSNVVGRRGWVSDSPGTEPNVFQFVDPDVESQITLLSYSGHQMLSIICLPLFSSTCNCRQCPVTGKQRR